MKQSLWASWSQAFRAYEQYVLLRWPGFWETRAHLFAPAGAVLLALQYALVSRWYPVTPHGDLPFFEGHFNWGCLISLLILLIWVILTAQRSGRRAATGGVRGWSRLLGALCATAVIGGLPYVQHAAVVASARSNCDRLALCLTVIRYELLFNRSVGLSKGDPGFRQEWKGTMKPSPECWEVLCREGTFPALRGIRPDPSDPDGWVGKVRDLSRDDRSELYRQLFGESIRFVDPAGRVVVRQDVSDLFRHWDDKVSKATLSWVGFRIQEFASIHQVVASRDSSTHAGLNVDGHPVSGPLLWMASCELIAFLVCFFSLPRWGVAVAAFGSAIGAAFSITLLTVIETVIEIRRPWGESPNRPWLDTFYFASVALPLGLYMVCLVPVLISMIRGRASFLTHVATYLVVSLVPAWLWLAAAVRVEHVKYDFDRLPSEVAWLRCTVVFILVPAFGLLALYVSNWVDSLPE